MSEPLQSEHGSYLAPRPEHARVADAMRHGILSCFPDASPRAAARTMTLHHVHTVAVSDPDGAGLLGVVSDRELLDALLDATRGSGTLGDLARPDTMTISSEQSLLAAIAAMRERGVDHAIVIDAHSGRPSGMLSTLDALGVFAWGEA